MSLRAAVLKMLAPYQYPQAVFGRHIARALGRQGYHAPLILDCPCGNGELSYRLSKISGARVKAVDMDQASVSRAAGNFKRSNLVFEKADIFECLARGEKYDVICIVNSLFLLPRHDELFTLAHACLRDESSQLIIITPNTEGDNFKAFQALNPLTNRHILNSAQLRTKARQMCFTITSEKEIAYASYFGRGELRFFSVLAPLYLLLLDVFKSLAKARQGNYIMYCLSRN